MREYFPAYYGKFKCIAADCPQSCCVGWDVVIDGRTEEKYRSVSGELGERLRSALYTDPDGDRVFRLAGNKKCPFWGEDRLCELHKALGEESLCETCARFPRISMEYEDFTEHTLALACPEAARLIVREDDAYAGFDFDEPAGCDTYNAELMIFLLDTRRRAADILSSEKALSERLCELTFFADSAQAELCPQAKKEEYDPYDVYSGLDYIDEANREKIINAIKYPVGIDNNERALTNIALYLLYRYWLSAIDSLCVNGTAGFIDSSVRIIAALAAHENMGTASAAALYSKEIEQSYENIEELL